MKFLALALVLPVEGLRLSAGTVAPRRHAVTTGLRKISMSAGGSRSRLVYLSHESLLKETSVQEANEQSAPLANNIQSAPSATRAPDAAFEALGTWRDAFTFASAARRVRQCRKLDPAPS